MAKRHTKLARKGGRVPEARWKERFIRKLTETGYVSKSAEYAGVARTVVYEHREKDEVFRKAWEEAEERYVEALEAEADRRGALGMPKLKFYQGEMVKIRDPKNPKKWIPYVENEYSDALLMFRLKAKRPDRYRDNASVEFSGPGKGPVQVENKLANLDFGALASFLRGERATPVSESTPTTPPNPPTEPKK